MAAAINLQDGPARGYYADEPEQDRFSALSVPASPSVESIAEEPVQREGRKWDKVGLIVTLVGLGVFLVGTWLLVFLNNFKAWGLFAGHPPLQTLAIACFTIGILTLQPTSQPKSKKAGLSRHQLIMLGLGFPSIVVGTALIFCNKIITEHGHFTTWHATFGLIAFVWMIVQILLGGLSVWFNGRAFGGNPKAKGVWKYHRASGYLLLPMFLMTAAIGGNYSDWAAGQARVGVRVLLYTIAPIAILLGLWSRVRLSKMNFQS